MTDDMKLPIDLGLAITTFNRANLLGPMVDYINSNGHKFEEICILDNGSTDGTYQYLRESISLFNCNLYRVEVNLGPSEGFSNAISYISERSRYILLIDDDCIPDVDALDKICSYILENDADVVCGSLISFNTGTYDPIHRGYLDNSPLSINITKPIEKHINSLIDASSINGMVIKKETYYKVGGIRSDFFYNYEDIDLSLRLSSFKGIHYLPSARFVHLEFRTTHEDLSVDRALERSARMIFNRRNLMWVAKDVKKFMMLYSLLYAVLLIKDIALELENKDNLKIRIGHRLLGFIHGLFPKRNSTAILKEIYLTHAASRL